MSYFSVCVCVYVRERERDEPSLQHLLLFPLFLFNKQECTPKYLQEV